MTDRLKDLRDVVPEIQTSLTPKIEVDHVDQESERLVQELNTQISGIEKDLKTLTTYVQEQKQIYQKMITITTLKDKSSLKNDLSKKITSITKLNKEINQNLDKMAKDIENKKKESVERKQKELDKEKDPKLVEILKSELNKLSPEIRIKQQQHISLLNEFQKIVNEYLSNQEEYKKNQNQRIRSQILMANPNLPQDEVDDMVEKMDEKQLKNVLTGSQKSTLNTHYDEAIETRKDILEIEQNLRELQDMFIAFGQMVSDQDHLLDNIEHNIGSAEEYVRAGEKQLVQTQEIRSFQFLNIFKRLSFGK